jgi:methyltransferase-like protein
MRSKPKTTMNRIPNNPEDDNNVHLPKSQFLKVQCLGDVPEEYLRQCSEMYERIKGFYASIESNLEEKDFNDEVDRKTDAMLRYIAFQEMQIAALQQEVVIFKKAMAHFAEAIDGKQDKLTF